MRINRNIAFTYFWASKRMTVVAILGVLLGMSIFMFMNSMAAGFDRASGESFFKSTPHIRIYKDDVVSAPLSSDTTTRTLIINPKVVPNKVTIENPLQYVQLVKQHPAVTVAFPQVNCPVFYNNGQSQST